MARCCPIVELRQYTLHPGMRDALVDLFDREFVESQEAVGIRVIGQFRDLDDPDRFVWLRGFESMAARSETLTAFYEGPVWAAYREAANATMLDSDNVLLLRPIGRAGGFDLDGARRDMPAASNDSATAPVIATIHYLVGTEAPAAAAAFAAFFDAEIRPKLGDSVLATLATEPSPNGFPRLPVREREHVFVWFARFRGVRACDDPRAWLPRPRDWREAAPRALLPQLMRRPETLRLAPTARSLLR